MEYEIEQEPRICWGENPKGYILSYIKEIEEGTSLEGLEEKMIDTDFI